jgi:hypothetical protein
MKNENEFFREIEIEFLIHELKDPISVIETGVRMLLERRERHGPLSLRQEKTLKRVLRNAQKARNMMYGLLEILIAPGIMIPLPEKSGITSMIWPYWTSWESTGCSFLRKRSPMESPQSC